MLDRRPGWRHGGGNRHAAVADTGTSAMNKERRDKFYGLTVEEWIEKIPGELPVDAVGLWQPVGRNSAAYCADRLANWRNTLRYSALRP